MHLAAEAGDLLYGGFSFNKVAEAQDLLAGATSFFRSFQHRHDNDGPPGLASDSNQFNRDYSQEHKCKFCRGVKSVGYGWECGGVEGREGRVELKERRGEI